MAGKIIYVKSPQKVPNLNCYNAVLPTQAQRQVKTLRLTQKHFLKVFPILERSLSLLRVTLQATSIVFHHYGISIMGVFKMGFS